MSRSFAASLLAALPRSLVLASVASVGLVACSSDTDGAAFTSADIAAEVPSGTIGGAPWRMQAAVVEPDPFESDRWSVHLFAEPVESCRSLHSATSPFVLFDVPATPGEYPLRLSLQSLEASQTVTFVTPPADNLVVTDGVITVGTVADGKVEIGLVARSGSNVVNGRVNADVCGAE